MNYAALARAWINFPIPVMERSIMNYASIDMEKTGQLLKTTIQETGFNVKYIQEYLHLCCPQPVYRWYKGQTLPSLDHFYSLSILLGKHIDELIVRKNP